MTDPKKTSREEDFRDYEQRDIRDGWPYADSDGDRTRQRNAPYGSPDASFDEMDNNGVEVSREPVIENVHGAPLPFTDAVEGTIEDDDLANRLIGRLEDIPQFDTKSLDIAVRHGVVYLDGTVDSDAERARLIGVVRAMAGVRDVRVEGLSSRGVDSHIPNDADE